MLASYGVTGSNYVTTMKYDANGIRREKYAPSVYGSTTTTYFYNGSNLVQERIVNRSSVQSHTYYKTYLYNSQGVIGFTQGSNTYTYRKNLFGDIVAIYNGATKVAEYAYDAWGNCTIVSDSNYVGRDNPFRYRGYYWDNDLQLYYLMSRYYDPATGRFINADTINYLEPDTINGLNLYAYCYNNPIMYVDPSGCYSIGIIFITMAMASILYWGISAACGEQFAGGVGSISSGATAISTGISLCAFGPFGIVAGIALIAIGALTIAFGVNEIADSIWGTNYIQDWTGWSDDVYNNVYMGLNIASAIGSIAGSIGMQYVSNIKLNNIMSDPQSVQKLNRFKFKTYARYSNQWDLYPCKNGKGMRALSNIKNGNAIRYGYGINNEEHFWGAYYWIVSNGVKFRFPFK